VPSSAGLREFPTAPSFFSEIGSVRTRAQRDQLQKNLKELRTLRNLIAHARQDRAELEEAGAWLKEHFDLPAPRDIEISGFAEALSDAKAKELEAKKAFTPVIRVLTDLLVVSEEELDQEAKGLIKDGIYVLEGWLVHFHRLHEMLGRQLDERRATSTTVLRAKPVKGEIDWGKLSREHIARYPKIRARLAE